MRVGVRVKPGARKDAVGGRWDGPSGEALIVSVAAPATEGKANLAVRTLLAKAFGVRKQDVELISGEKFRDKVVEISGAAEATKRLAELLDL